MYHLQGALPTDRNEHCDQHRAYARGESLELVSQILKTDIFLSIFMSDFEKDMFTASNDTNQQ